MLLELEPVEVITEQVIPDYYEVVRGQVVEVLPMSFYACEVANNLKDLLDHFLVGGKFGRTRIEQNYLIPLPEDKARVMRPDLAFVSFDRCPKDRPMSLVGLGLGVIPEFVVEVISPTDKAEDVMVKTQDYFRGGVSTVWQIYPTSRFTLVFDDATTGRLVREEQELAVPQLLGFTFKLADILPPVEVKKA